MRRREGDAAWPGQSVMAPVTHLYRQTDTLLIVGRGIALLQKPYIPLR